MTGAKEPLDIAQAKPEPKTLVQKILEIQDRVGVVKKQGTFGTEMGSAKYLRIEDAVVAVNKLLTLNKLILTGEIVTYDRTVHERAGKVPGELQRSGYISTVRMTWTIDDTETGEARAWSFVGDGYDATDKSIYKAMTGCRKYAIINIFNLPIGNDVEEHTLTWDDKVAAQKAVVKKKLVQAATSENPSVRQAAIDGLEAQAEPPKALTITRPEDFNGHFFIASGLIAVPQLDQFFEDTGSKRLNSKKTGKVGWKVEANYEKSLIELCAKLQIAVEG